MSTINVHSVTYEDLHLPAAFRSADSAGGGGLTRAQIDVWIRRGASQINGILVSKGVDVDTLTNDATGLVQSGIVAYVRLKVFTQSPGYEAQARVEGEEWGSIRKTLREQPGELGKSEDAAGSIASTVPVLRTPANAPKYSGPHKRGW